MPELKEILKRVRQLEIRSKRLSNQVLAGKYHSAFKGRGMSFKEVREYVPGDDIRFIDWNVSARLGHPYSKMFEEERSLNIMLMLDVTASMALGSRLRTKRELMAELAAALAYSAMRNNDKVGALFFTDKVEVFIPPAKGKNHVLALLRRLLMQPFEAKKTNAQSSLKFLMQVLKETTIVINISDFVGPEPGKLLKALPIKHDCIAIQLFDAMDAALNLNGLVQLKDAETGETRWVDAASSLFSMQQKQYLQQDQQEQAAALRQAGWDYIPLKTTQDFVPVLQHFFTQRIQKRNS